MEKAESLRKVLHSIKQDTDESIVTTNNSHYFTEDSTQSVAKSSAVEAITLYYCAVVFEQGTIKYPFCVCFCYSPPTIVQNHISNND